MNLSLCVSEPNYSGRKICASELKTACSGTSFCNITVHVTCMDKSISEIKHLEN